MTASHFPALLVIDVQDGFDDPSWGRRDNPDAETNVDRLMTAWEAAGAPLVVVQHASRSTVSPLHPDRPGHALKPFVRDRGDLLVTKNVNSAFYGDVDLRAWLADRGVTALVLCGIQTNMCVETTARMAGNLGYDTTVALDACHTFGLTGPYGPLTAEELTRATVTSLVGGRFARVESTRRVVADLAATPEPGEG